MGTFQSVTSGSSARIDTSGLAKFIPEPVSRLAAGFRSVLNGVSTVVGGATQATGLWPEYQDLIGRQMEMQEQMQLVSMESNIEKSKHETQMAAIRNIRAG